MAEALTILTSCSDEWQAMWEITFPSKVEYADRWQCRLIDRRGTKQATAEPWARVAMWRQTLSECPAGAFLWFIGADAMITNQAVDWRKLTKGDHDITIGLDILGINSDSILFRHTPKMLEMLDEVASLRGNETNEQDALHRVMSRVDYGSPYYDVRIVPQSWCNAYPYAQLYNYGNNKGGQWTTESLVLHVPGEPYHRRLDFLREAAKHIIR